MNSSELQARRVRMTLLALFLAALALRPQVVGVGPLIPEIQDDLHTSHAVAGLLGTIPVLCMGLSHVLHFQLVRGRSTDRLTARQPSSPATASMTQATASSNARLTRIVQ